MHPLTTIAKLNREAAEASHILNAHAPAAPKPEGPQEQVRKHLANARQNIERILGGAQDK